MENGIQDTCVKYVFRFLSCLGGGGGWLPNLQNFSVLKYTVGNKKNVEFDVDLEYVKLETSENNVVRPVAAIVHVQICDYTIYMPVNTRHVSCIMSPFKSF